MRINDNTRVNTLAILMLFIACSSEPSSGSPTTSKSNYSIHHTLSGSSEETDHSMDKSDNNKSDTSNKNIDVKYSSHLSLEKSKPPINLDMLKLNFLVAMVTNRGIFAISKVGWKISDLFIPKDKGGMDLYNKVCRESNEPFIKTNVLGECIFLVRDIEYVKPILDESPNRFSVGTLKNKIFKSFMKDNVAVSDDPEWTNRRRLNDKVVCYQGKHIYAESFNNSIKEILSEKLPRNHDDLVKTSRRIVSRIVFGDKNQAPDKVFQVFDEANKFQALIQKDYHIRKDVMDAYIEYVLENINSPKKNSLVELSVNYLDYCPYSSKGGKKSLSKECKHELIHQIPHYMFPMLGAFINVAPRCMTMLANHPKKLKRVIEEIKKYPHLKAEDIYQMEYLRKCLLEELRLNPSVLTMFRTAEYDTDFGIHSNGKRYKFSKGTQFLILNSPYMRDERYFKVPNKFIPERWNKELEKSYNNTTFGQGKQDCPGKDIAMFMMTSYIAHYIKMNHYKLKAIKIDTDNIEQVLNPTKLKFF